MPYICNVAGTAKNDAPTAVCQYFPFRFCPFPFPLPFPPFLRPFAAATAVASGPFTSGTAFVWIMLSFRRSLFFCNGSTTMILWIFEMIMIVFASFAFGTCAQWKEFARCLFSKVFACSLKSKGIPISIIKSSIGRVQNLPLLWNTISWMFTNDGWSTSLCSCNGFLWLSDMLEFACITICAAPRTLELVTYSI